MWAIFLGCLLVAFGPSAALIYYCVSQRPQLTIVCLSAAFFWMCSVFATSLFWLIAKVLGIQGPVFLTVCFGVLVQEASRVSLEDGLGKSLLLRWIISSSCSYCSSCSYSSFFPFHSSSSSGATTRSKLGWLQMRCASLCWDGAAAAAA